MRCGSSRGCRAEPVRVFLALPLPEALRDDLEDLALTLRAGRLVPAENYHVTLAFLGEQSEADLERLHVELQKLSSAPFSLQIEGLEAPGSKAPRVLWAKLASNPELTALHKAIRGRLRLCDMDLPRERFRPHITLARFARPLRRGDAMEIASFLQAEGGYRPNAFPCSGFTLYQSRLTSDGALYEELAHYPFQSEPQENP